MRTRGSVAQLALLLAALAALAAGGATAQDTIPVGSSPGPIAVNPLAGLVYVGHTCCQIGVTVIDAADGSSENVELLGPIEALAVDSRRNRIYVVEQNDASVVVIDAPQADGESHVIVGRVPVGDIFAGDRLEDLVVDPVSNRAYVVWYSGSFNDPISVVEIDGSDLSTRSLEVGFPRDRTARGLAVDPATSFVYAAMPGRVPGDSRPYLVAIDPRGDELTVPGAWPVDSDFFIHRLEMAYDPATRRLYAVDGRDTLTVVDATDFGSDPMQVTVSEDQSVAYPIAVTVNPVTNQIYVANDASEEGHVVVVDGADFTTETVMGVGLGFATQIGVNPTTNRIFVTGAGGVTVIDGADLSKETLPVVSSSGPLAVDPLANRVYVVTSGVTVLAEERDTTVDVGGGPVAVAVDPLTSRVYVANREDATVTAIDATGGVSTLPAGSGPVALAVDALARRVYVANSISNDITVIDSGDDSSETVSVGALPLAVAVNSQTGRVYVANQDDNSVTAIEGSDLGTETIAVGQDPAAVAVNAVTNRIYVANEGDGSVTVIDGATLATTPVPVGTAPSSLVVNEGTNTIYVANRGSDDVTVIDGRDGSTQTVPVLAGPSDVAVNAETNRVYVSNATADAVTIIDGEDLTTESVAVGDNPVALAVELTRNRVYVANNRDGTLAVIDEGLGTVRFVAAGTDPVALAVDPTAASVYVANLTSDDVTVLSERREPVPLEVAITRDQGNVSTTPTPTLTFEATTGFLPFAPPVDQIYYQVDTWTGPWLAAEPAGANATGQTPPLLPGEHIVYAFAVDGQDATSIHPTPAATPLVGAIASYPLVVVPEPAAVILQLGALLTVALLVRRSHRGVV